VGGSKSFPCFPDDVEQPHSTDDKRPSKLKANFKSVKMAWFDERGVEMTSVGVKSHVGSTRVYVNTRKNLTLVDARTENTGRYQCVATATVGNNSKIAVMNVLRINGQL